jgi:hypothetical protein
MQRHLVLNMVVHTEIGVDCVGVLVRGHSPKNFEGWGGAWGTLFAPALHMHSLLFLNLFH